MLAYVFGLERHNFQWVWQPVWKQFSFWFMWQICTWWTEGYCKKSYAASCWNNNVCILEACVVSPQMKYLSSGMKQQTRNRTTAVYVCYDVAEFSRLRWFVYSWRGFSATLTLSYWTVCSDRSISLPTWRLVICAELRLGLPFISN